MSFNPSKSVISEKSLVDFICSATYSQIVKVPGIGATTARALAECDPPVSNVYQLMGLYLTFRGQSVSQEKWCQSMFDFLVKAGSQKHWAASITHALAEKLNLYYPGLYDANTFGDANPEDVVAAPDMKVVAKDGTVYKTKSVRIKDEVVTELIGSTGDKIAHSLRLIKGIGLGPKSLDALEARGITSLYQLCGVYLTLRQTKMEKQDYLNTCFRWSIDAGIASGYAASVVYAITSYIESKFPGLCVARVSEGAAAISLE
jgi:hypothetical protein